jgi:hypothetical protein
MKSKVNTKGLTRSEIICECLKECIYNGEVENNQLWDIWINVGKYLGLCSPAQYSEQHKISPQAVYKKKIKEYFGYKFLIDND